jgi:Ca2+-binding RTX toxin-like protein
VLASTPVEVNGGNGDEQFTTTANGTRVRFDRLNPAPFSIDIGTSENLVLNANGGNDSFSATGNLATLIQITVDGGAGDDTLLGSNGADILIGGDNTDFIDGQQGNDTVFLGAGDDTFQWDPGDGSDTVEGQAGTDRLLFNGANIAETFDVSANGSRVRFTRNIGNVTMDLDDVETIELNALGGADIINVNNLTGTDLTTFNAELASTIAAVLAMVKSMSSPSMELRLPTPFRSLPMQALSK